MSPGKNIEPVIIVCVGKNLPVIMVTPPFMILPLFLSLVIDLHKICFLFMYLSIGDSQNFDVASFFDSRAHTVSQL